MNLGLFLIINAIKLGWNIDIVDHNTIILTKNNNKLTNLDKNTPKLIKKLFSNNI